MQVSLLQSRTRNTCSSSAGFTLIETLIYLALFGIIMGSLAVTTYSIVEAIGRGDTRVVMQEEGEFVLAKLNWALGGARSVTIGSTPPSLHVNTYGSGNPLVFDTDAGNLRLQVAGGEAVSLNSNTVRVANFTVTEHQAVLGKPQGVTISFTMQGTTPKGVQLSQDFITTKYVRK